MDFYIPFDAIDPKTRLEPPLTATERGAFAEAMLFDVIDAVQQTQGTPRVLSTAPIDIPCPVVVDERPLTRAVNGLLAMADDPVAILMADLPLVTADAIDRLVDTTGDVVAAPGIGGGTNALVVRDLAFRVDFHGCSIADHEHIATDADLDFSTVDSFTLGVDIDEAHDLAEVLLHGNGRANQWLREHGFSISTADDHRVSVDRRPRD